MKLQLLVILLFIMSCTDLKSCKTNADCNETEYCYAQGDMLDTRYCRERIQFYKQYENLSKEAKNTTAQNWTFPGKRTEVIVDCEIEVKLTRECHAWACFITECHRCKNTSKSIMPNIIPEGDWICPV